MQCKFCKQSLSSKSALSTHQQTAKYCLKIQGKEDTKGIFTCDLCEKSFNNNNRFKSHKSICKSNIFYVKELKKSKEEVKVLKEKYMLSEERCSMLREELEKSRSDYKELSITAVKRPTSSKNIQINNYIQNMAPLKMGDIEDTVPMLTLDHHVKGAEGYAEYALEFPFKDKIVCVDVGRNKIKYKNDEGEVIEDVGFQKMMVKLCEALKDRSFNLCQEHYEKLSKEFTEVEMDEYNCMETAMAITKYANGRENEFCSNIIKLISKGSKR
jgi:hypothetical protein